MQDQRGIPKAVFTKEFVENFDKEMAIMEVKDRILASEMNLYFLVYRAMESIAIICVCLSYVVYGTEYFMSPIIMGILFAIISSRMLKKTEGTANEIIELNVQKRTKVYEMAITSLYKDSNV